MGNYDTQCSMDDKRPRTLTNDSVTTPGQEPRSSELFSGDQRNTTLLLDVSYQNQ